MSERAKGVIAYLLATGLLAGLVAIIRMDDAMTAWLAFWGFWFAMSILVYVYLFFFERD